MTTITTQLNIEIKDGPDIAIKPIVIEAEAYDKIDISIEGSSEAKGFTIESSNKIVSFLLITSSLYTPNDVKNEKKLTFQIGDDSNKSINLSSPQLYIGKDAISKLFGDVKKITFKNNLEKKESQPNIAEISILIGRDVYLKKT